MRLAKSVLIAMLLSGLQIGLSMGVEKIISIPHYYWFDMFLGGALTAFWALHLVKPSTREE